MSPSRTPRYALSDVTQQQNMAPPVLTNAAGGFDHSAMLVDETEAFALEPIDVTAIGEYVMSVSELRHNDVIIVIIHHHITNICYMVPINQSSSTPHTDNTIVVDNIVR